MRYTLYLKSYWNCLIIHPAGDAQWDKHVAAREAHPTKGCLPTLQQAKHFRTTPPERTAATTRIPAARNERYQQLYALCARGLSHWLPNQPHGKCVTVSAASLTQNEKLMKLDNTAASFQLIARDWELLFISESVYMSLKNNLLNVKFDVMFIFHRRFKSLSVTITRAGTLSINRLRLPMEQ